jgi:uncharacterized membrane protein YhaH (DUF805 family)
MLMPLKRYADFSGRSRRKEYWLFLLFIILVSVGVGVVEAALGLAGTVGPYGAVSLLFAIAIIVPSIAVGVRRLHDTDRSGWWILISFVPIVGSIVLLVFYVLEGTRGPNRFGPDPKGGVSADVFA